MATSAQQLSSVSTSFGNVDSLHSRHYLESVKDYYASPSSERSLEGLNAAAAAAAAADCKETSPSFAVPPAPPSSPAQSKKGGGIQLPSISSLCLRGVLQKELPFPRLDRESDSLILFSPFPSSSIFPLYPASIQPDGHPSKRPSSSLLRDTLTHCLAEQAETQRAAYDELVAMKRRATLPSMAYQEWPSSKGRPFSPIDFNFRRRAMSTLSATVSPTSHLKVNFKPLRCKSPNSLDAINGLLTLSGAKKVSNNTITNVSVYELLQSRSSQSPADKALRKDSSSTATMPMPMPMAATSSSSSLSSLSSSASRTILSTGSATHEAGNAISSNGSSVCESLISEYASLAKKKRRVHMCSHRDCYKIFPSLSRLERHERVHEEKKSVSL